MYKILEAVKRWGINNYGDFLEEDYREIGVVKTEEEAKAFVDRYSYSDGYIYEDYQNLHCGKLIYEEVRELNIDECLDEQIKIAEEATEYAECLLNACRDDDKREYEENLDACREHLEKLKKIKEE